MSHNREILKVIADNPALLEEVKAVLLAEFETLPIELGLTNEKLGERVRAREENKLGIERAFSKILAYQSVKPKEEPKNPAR